MSKKCKQCDTKLEPKWYEGQVKKTFYRNFRLRAYTEKEAIEAAVSENEFPHIIVDGWDDYHRSELDCIMEVKL